MTLGICHRDLSICLIEKKNDNDDDCIFHMSLNEATSRNRWHRCHHWIAEGKATSIDGIDRSVKKYWSIVRSVKCEETCGALAPKATQCFVYVYRSPVQDFVSVSCQPEFRLVSNQRREISPNARCWLDMRNSGWQPRLTAPWTGPGLVTRWQAVAVHCALCIVT